MNIEQLLAAFIAAGFDTPEKVQAALTELNVGLQIRRVDEELVGLSKKQTELLKPITDRRTELLNQRNVLSESLIPKP